MRKNRLHYPEEKFLGYYYDREATDKEFSEHLLSCHSCGVYYLELERALNKIKSAFREEREIPWEAQRQRITAALKEGEKRTFTTPWRTLAPLAAAVLIAVTFILSFDSGKVKNPIEGYRIMLSQNDELLLKEMQALMNKPLSESLQTINFWMRLAEQEDQPGLLSPPIRRIGGEDS